MSDEAKTDEILPLECSKCRGGEEHPDMVPGRAYWCETCGSIWAIRPAMRHEPYVKFESEDLR